MPVAAVEDRMAARLLNHKLHCFTRPARMNSKAWRASAQNRPSCCIVTPKRTHIVARCHAHDSQQQPQQQQASRRAVLAISGAMLVGFQQQHAAWAEEAVDVADAAAGAVKSAQPAAASLPMKTVADSTLAYAFEYPSATVSGKQLPLVFSRRPERYSSAAPLTADARQRIVCELADLIDSVTVSLTVGPPSAYLKAKPTTEWQAAEVAQSVLIDRSTARITTGQRISLNNVESASAEVRGDDGTTYYVFEHVSQGSPTLRALSRETYRHALAVTAVRPGLDGTPFLYTLNMSCPQDLWDDVQPGFAQGVASFRLLPPGPGFVAPDQDPWRFF